MKDICINNDLPAISFLPASAILELTYKCNLKCLFCSCPWENSNRNFNKGVELSTNKWKEIIKKVSSMGVSDICFTGAEKLF